MSMKKSELIEVAAMGAETSKATARRVLEVALDAISESLATGNEVRIAGFGTFKPSQRAARTARHPRTGETVEIPAATVPRFVAGAGLKAVVAGEKKRVSCQPDRYVRELLELLENARGHRKPVVRRDLSNLAAFKQRCRNSAQIHGLLAGPHAPPQVPSRVDEMTH
jgi:nucleoid DNA-binding protein